MPQLLARSRAPVTLARGEHDAMNTDEQHIELGVASGQGSAAGVSAAVVWTSRE
jgi:hypothetical protein